MPGDPPPPRPARHRQALRLFRRIGERYGEAGASNGLGEALRGADADDDAMAAHAAALALARQISENEAQAHAHVALATIHHAAGQKQKTREHWKATLERHTTIGSPHASSIRARLPLLYKE